jgi:hypothetical protein
MRVYNLAPGRLDQKWKHFAQWPDDHPRYVSSILQSQPEDGLDQADHQAFR